MRGIPFGILFILATLPVPGRLSAQGFAGGAGDGYAMANSAAPSQISPTGYFNGGIGDGYSTNLSPNFSYSANRFFGGDADGYAMAMTQEFIITTEKYYGGDGDGYASGLSTVVKMQSAYTLPQAPAGPLIGNDKAFPAANAQHTISIYPNPSRDIITVSRTGCETASGVLSVFNMLGQQIFSMELSPGHDTRSIPIDISHFPPATYLLVMRWSCEGMQHSAQALLLRGE